MLLRFTLAPRENLHRVSCMQADIAYIALEIWADPRTFSSAPFSSRTQRLAIHPGEYPSQCSLVPRRLRGFRTIGRRDDSCFANTIGRGNRPLCHLSRSLPALL